MELREALQQISEIRHQMARTEVFRGYRASTVGFSGALGLLAAVVQSHWIPTPANQLERYLTLWISVALLSLLVAGAELFRRMRRSQLDLIRDMTKLAVEQFAPCLAVGALITACIYQHAPQVAWMLPGLWSSLFGLGIFASCRWLPSAVNWGGLYYVICGACLLRWGQGEFAFSPWLMAIAFGGGQFLCAGILYWTLERRHVAQITIS